ncbi:hypothetical protein NHF46_11685 [Arthrobacter alpinus]|nr:hypothetical protein [Arthrobacter alpinus]
MPDWNDVLAVLDQDPAVRSWTPIPGAVRAVQAIVSTESHGEVTMVIENGANELWLQILVSISETSEGAIWEAAGQYLRDLPAIGLAQHEDGIAIRHGILLSHADMQAVSNGITLTANAATTLSKPPPKTPLNSPRRGWGAGCGFIPRNQAGPQASRKPEGNPDKDEHPPPLSHQKMTGKP